jgi:cell division protein FtsQ
MTAGTLKKQNRHLTFSWKSFLKKMSYVTLVVIVLLSVAKLRHMQIFPISNVKIFGAQHIDKKDLQELVSPFVSKGFFAVDVDRIKEKLMPIPWVSEVIVRKNWPNQVIITITEKHAVARWNETSLLSSSGELFSPPQDTYPVGLPSLAGPNGEQLSMMDNYAKMNSLLMPLHFKITSLELSPTKAWSLTLDNGIKLNLGHKDVLTRIGHFVKVYPKIVGDKVENVEYIDLRYTNGIAVRWKSNTK